VAINGVMIFGNSDANNLDAYLNEGVSFDTCGGHPQQQGVYHYHAETSAGCVYTDVKGQHSPLFGWMFDGVPIYGVYGDNGAYPTNLDVCNGHIDTTYPFYHYHVTANMTYPYTVNCLKGCISNTVNTLLNSAATACTPQATQYDYSSLRMLLVDGNNTTTNSTTTVSLTTTASPHKNAGIVTRGLTTAIIVTFLAMLLQL
jgi:hypothetical protein